MDAEQLKDRIKESALAFRGYNVTNLGRSAELLNHSAYGAIVEDHLRRASRVCSDAIGKRVDLVQRVRAARDTTLKTYPEALALIVAMEIAQIELLREIHGVDYKQGELAFGYSLGEITGLIASCGFEFEEVLRIPLMLAQDTAALAGDITLAVLFSRGDELTFDEVRRLCLQINQEGSGVISIQSVLSPNSLLMMGQGSTVDRFGERMGSELSVAAHLRKNKNRWPPIHTPVIWERNIPNRCGILLHTLPGGMTPPQPPILSLVTGEKSYTDVNVRDLVCRWTDHPQLLWNAVYATLASDIQTVIHVGPAPNIIPATFKRLSDNVETQMKRSLGVRALAIAHPWLKAVLPRRAALLRAPLIEHVILEDWLLAQTF
jgi:[acyl-carrier-protein] S-malonyltransferase